MSDYVVLGGEVCALAERLGHPAARLVACVRAAWCVMSAFSALPVSAAGPSTSVSSQMSAASAPPPLGALLRFVSPTFVGFVSVLDMLSTRAVVSDDDDDDEGADGRTQARAPSCSRSWHLTESQARCHLDDTAALAVLVTALVHPYQMASLPVRAHTRQSPSTSTSVLLQTETLEVPAAFSLFIAALECWDARVAELAASRYDHFYRFLRSRLASAGQERPPKATGRPPSPQPSTSVGRARAVRRGQGVYDARSWSNASVMRMCDVHRERLQTGHAPPRSTPTLALTSEASFTERNVVDGKDRDAQRQPPADGVCTATSLRARRRVTDGTVLYVDAEDVLSTAEGYWALLPPLMQTSEGIEEIHRLEPCLVPLFLSALVRLNPTPPFPLSETGRDSVVRDNKQPEPAVQTPTPAARAEATLRTLGQLVCALAVPNTPVPDTAELSYLSSASAPLGIFIVRRLLLRLIAQAAPALGAWRRALHESLAAALQRAAAVLREEEVLDQLRDEDEDAVSASSSSGDAADLLAPLRARAQQVHVYEQLKVLCCTQLCSTATSSPTSSPTPASAPGSVGPVRAIVTSAAPLDVAAWRRQRGHPASSANSETDGDTQWVLQCAVSLLHAQVVEWSMPLSAFGWVESVVVWAATAAYARAQQPLKDSSRLRAAELEEASRLVASSASCAETPMMGVAHPCSRSHTLTNVAEAFRRRSQRCQRAWSHVLTTACFSLAPMSTLWTRLDAAGVLFLFAPAPVTTTTSAVIADTATVHAGRPVVRGECVRRTPSSPMSRAAASPAVTKQGGQDSSPRRSASPAPSSAGRSSSVSTDVSATRRSARVVLTGTPLASPARGEIIRGTPTPATTGHHVASFVAAPARTHALGVWSVDRLPERLPTTISLASTVWLTSLTLLVVCPRLCDPGAHRSTATAAANAYVDWFFMALLEGLRRSTSFDDASLVERGRADVGGVTAAAATAAATGKQRDAWERREAPAVVTSCLVALAALIEAMPSSALQGSVTGPVGAPTTGGASRAGAHHNLAKLLSTLSSIYFTAETRTASTDARRTASRHRQRAKSPARTRLGAVPSGGGGGADESGGARGRSERVSLEVLSTVPQADVLAFLAAEAAGRWLQCAYDLACTTVRSGRDDGAECRANTSPATLAALMQVQSAVWLLCEAAMQQPAGIPLSSETQAALAALVSFVSRLQWESARAWTANETRESPSPPPSHVCHCPRAAAILRDVWWLLVALVDVIVHSYAAGCPLILCDELANAALSSAHTSSELLARVRRGLAELEPTDNVSGATGWSHLFTNLHDTAPQPVSTALVDGAPSCVPVSLPPVVAVLALEVAGGALVSPPLPDGQDNDRPSAPSAVRLLGARHERRGIAETLLAVLGLFHPIMRSRAVAPEATAGSGASAGRAPSWERTVAAAATCSQAGVEAGVGITASPAMPCSPGGDGGVGVLMQRLPIANPYRRSSGGPSGDTVGVSVRAASTPTGRLEGFIPAGRAEVKTGRRDLWPRELPHTAAPVGNDADSPGAVTPTWMPTACQRWWARTALAAMAGAWWATEADTVVH